MGNYQNWSVDDLLNELLRYDRMEVRGVEEVKRAIRVELFKRGLTKINGVPIEVLRRNPLVEEEYKIAMGELNETDN